MPERRRVLIVGGGIAGLALAPLLARSGDAVEVIERAPAWRDAGAGIYLPGNAVRALRALGLEAPIASRAVEIAQQRFCDHRGRLPSSGSCSATASSRCAGRRTAFLSIPIDEQRVYCYCDVVAPDHQETERLAELFSGFADPAATLLGALDVNADIHVSTIEEVALDRWAHGRVVLIGDAAHATSPNMAQGAAMALEDALVLTDCLRRIPAIPAALAAFEARRRPRTDWVRAQTHRRDRTRYLPPRIRDGILRLLGPRIFRSNYRPLLSEP